MIILQAQPLPQPSHYAVSAIVEPQSIPLRKVPILEQKDYELFAQIERSTQKMTKQDLMKAMGIGSDEGSSY